MVKFCLVKRWSLSLVKNDPKCMYIFGDNDIQKGKGGQAIIRDLPNAWGIPTKRIPSFDKKAYYTEDKHSEQSIKIQNAVDKIRKELEKGYYTWVALPEDGLGTGLAKLPTKAPSTFNYLLDELYGLVEEFDSGKLESFKKYKGYQKRETK